MDLRPDSPAYATQLRLITARIVAAANDAAGTDAVRPMRVLPPPGAALRHRGRPLHISGEGAGQARSGGVGVHRGDAAAGGDARLVRAAPAGRSRAHHQPHHRRSRTTARRPAGREHQLGEDGPGVGRGTERARGIPGTRVAPRRARRLTTASPAPSASAARARMWSP
nr:hypothetical protein [Streptomyces cacaoi]